MAYADQFYKDANGGLHWLSALDQETAARMGLALPDPAWTVLGQAEAQAILNPPLTLAQAQAAQMAVLTAACDAAITGGFSASALGGAYSYPAAATDQANMVQTAAAAGGGLLMCESAANVWALAAHSQAQAATVLAAFVSWRDKQRQQLATLTAQVAAAATVAAVQAVVWP